MIIFWAKLEQAQGYDRKSKQSTDNRQSSDNLKTKTIKNYKLIQIIHDSNSAKTIYTVSQKTGPFFIWA